MESQLVGLAVVDENLLVADGIFSLEDSLTVIYGLNGAGKSRLLDGLADALRGVRSDKGIALIVRATREYQRSHGHGNPVTLALADSIKANPPRALRNTAQRARRELFTSEATANELVDAYIEDVTAPGDARRSALQDRLFLLYPCGTEETARWQAWAVADPQEDWVSRETAVLDEMWAEHDQRAADVEDEDWDGVEEAFRDKVAEFTLFPTAGRDDEYVLIGADHTPSHLGPFSPLGFGAGHYSRVHDLKVEGRIDLGIDLVSVPDSLTAATATHITEQLIVAGILDHDAALSDEVTFAELEEFETAIAERLSAAVTDRLGRVLYGAPSAHLRFPSVGERLKGALPEWRFGRDIALRALSRAERIWAERSIAEVLHHSRQTLNDRVTLHLYDEPETALHRAAETHMARALVERTRDPRHQVIAATHSPELLDTETARVIEVKKFGPASQVQPMTVESRSALEGLGLNPSDLLRLTRVFLLVEGLHDELLLNHYLGDRLRAARIEVIPIRGGKQLASTLDSRVLFDYTSAQLVVLLDNTSHEQVVDVWDRASILAAAGDLGGAHALVNAEIASKKTGEASYLASWMNRALERDSRSRLTPAGLSAPDVLDYLPVQKFRPNAESWQELRAQHAATGTKDDFKTWLRRKYGIRFTPETILEAAEGTPVPSAFERLMKQLEAIAIDRG